MKISITKPELLNMQYHEWEKSNGPVGKDFPLFLILVFGSFGNEPMQSCSVRCVVLSSVASALASSVASVYSPPSNSFDHRNFMSCKYMCLYP